MIDLNRQLETWLADGIISAEQAELMRGSVLRSHPDASTEAAEERRIPIVTEILGYVGAALASWAVLFLVSEFWGNLEDWAQASLFGALALVLFAAGSTLLEARELALGRLSSVLWAGSVLALSGALFIIFDSIVGYSDDTSLTLTGAGAAVAGGLMLRRQRSVAQHVVFFAAVMTTLTSLLYLGIDPETFVYGFVVWGAGLIWILLSRAGVLQPLSTGLVLGAFAMLVGAQIAVGEGDIISFGLVLGLATAGLFAAAGIVLKEKPVIILGGIGIFWFVPQAMFHFFGETFGGMLGLFISGLAIVLLALWFGRQKEAQ